MTPQDKAKELVDKYKSASFNCKGCDMPYCDVPCTMLSIYESKQCALIAVDEILETVVVYDDISKDYEFWKQVKQEIEKL